MAFLRKFFSLPAPERLFLLAVGLLLVVLRAALKVLPFRQVTRLVRTAGRRLRSRRVGDAAYRRHVSWGVPLVARHLLPKRPCLPQALAAQFLLLRRGCPARLRIGVAKASDGTLEAHAWLESGGEIVVGGSRAAQRYAAFDDVEVPAGPESQA